MPVAIAATAGQFDSSMPIGFKNRGYFLACLNQKLSPETSDLLYGKVLTRYTHTNNMNIIFPAVLMKVKVFEIPSFKTDIILGKHNLGRLMYSNLTELEDLNIIAVQIATDMPARYKTKTRLYP